MSKDENTIQSVAKASGLPLYNTEKAIEDITKGIILRTYRKRPVDDRDHKINEKVKAAFKTLYPNGKWMDDFGDVAAIAAMGPPGHGKTTSFEKAAERAAMAMGMRFVDRKMLTPDFKIDPDNDFVFVSQEFSGENSKHSISGIPSKKEGFLTTRNEQAIYMDYLRDRRFELLAKAPAGLLLLDDFANAQPGIQNIGLALIEEGRYQGLNLPNVYVAPTGNLGALDGTYTSPFSTAMVNRLRLVFVEDTLENFTVRGQQAFRDELGDMLVLSFLEVKKELFAAFPDASNRGKPFNSPRSWIKLINTLRQEAMFEGSPEAVSKNLYNHAQSLVGTVCAEQFRTYFVSAMEGAVPLARQAITTGEMDLVEYKKRAGSDHSQKGFSFNYQFSVAIAEQAVAALIKTAGKSDKEAGANMKRVVANMTKALMNLDESNMDNSFTLFKDRLANQVDSMAIQNSDKAQMQRQLKLDVLKQINVAVFESPAGQKLDDSRYESIWAALSGSRKAASGSDLRSQRGKRVE